jgi:hypothetical protein
MFKKVKEWLWNLFRYELTDDDIDLIATRVIERTSTPQYRGQKKAQIMSVSKHPNLDNHVIVVYGNGVNPIDPNHPEVWRRETSIPHHPDATQEEIMSLIDRHDSSFI